MADKFFNQADKKMRLDQTVCLYNDKPYYVYADPLHFRGAPALKEEEVFIVDLVTRASLSYEFDGSKFSIAKYTDDLFSYKPFPLGYVNYDTDAYYIQRGSPRNQKQGLCSTNLVIPRNCPVIISSQEFVDCILGVYPSFREALEKTEMSTSTAFSRDMAVQMLNRSAGVRGLLFHGSNIGMIIGSKVKLYPSSYSSLISLELKEMGIEHEIGF